MCRKPVGLGANRTRTFIGTGPKLQVESSKVQRRKPYWRSGRTGKPAPDAMNFHYAILRRTNALLRRTAGNRWVQRMLLVRFGGRGSGPPALPTRIGAVAIAGMHRSSR